MSIYSQASNGKESSTSEVSCQTGMYNYTIPLCSLMSLDETNQEAKRDISLSYDVLSHSQPSGTTPFGFGWSFDGLSKFSDGKILKLSNGQQYSYEGSDPTSNAFSFHDQKTQDFQASYASGFQEIHVFHKDGVLEILTDMGRHGFLLTSLTFPNGETFSFQYENNSNQLCLRAIIDPREVSVLKVEYGQGQFKSVGIWRSDSYATTYAVVTNHSTYSTLDMISRPAGPGENANFACFSYRKIDEYVLVAKVDYPEGSSEEITYDSLGHKYKTTSGTRSLPRVVSHTIEPGTGIPGISEIYRYPGENEGSRNFLGYPNTYDWDFGRDNIYAWGSASSYSYWVECVTAQGTLNETVRRVNYNAFHLTVSETSSKMGCTTETRYLYPCDEDKHKDKNLKELPENLKHPTRVTRTFSMGGERRSFDTNLETDCYGNTLKVIHPTGITETFDYYPVSGHENCPADPFGLFSRFLKAAVTTSSDGLLRKGTHISYIPLAPLNGAPISLRHVVKMSEIEVGDGGQSLLVSLQHLERPDSFFTHNSLLKVSLTMPGAGEKGKFSTICDFATVVRDEFVTKTKTVIGHDGTTFSSSETRLAYSNLLTRSVDRSGLVYEGTYDCRGRILTHKRAPGTDFEEKTSYQYCVFDEETKTSIAIRTLESTGSKIRISSTGTGEISEASIENSTQFLPVLLYEYDNVGQVRSETRKDYYPNGIELCSVTVYKQYDGWGQLCESRDSNGVTTMFRNNPFNLSQKVEVEHRDASGVVRSRLASETTKFNCFKKPVLKVVQSMSSGTIETTTEYDGFGRKTKTTSPQGQETIVEEYDFLDRILSIRSPEDVIFRFHYPGFSPKNTLERIELSNNGMCLEVGQQTVDGIDRVTSKTSNGFKTTYSYSSGNKFPDKIVTPARNSISLQYNSIFDSLPSTIQMWRGESSDGHEPEIRNTFTYATNTQNGTTKLAKASNRNGSYQYWYSSSGEKERMEQLVGNQRAETIFQASSLLGRPLKMQFRTGTDTTCLSYSYDECGRLKTTTQGQLWVELDYDNLFGMCREAISDETGSFKKQVTELAYDDLGREEGRSITTFSTEKKHIFCHKYTYDKENKLICQLVTVNGERKVCENYSYDKCSRLIRYYVSGEFDQMFLPGVGQDFHRFKSQRFNFNHWNNITQVVTTLSDGSVDTAIWNYKSKDARHPKSIQHSLTSHFPETEEFTYDGDGNISNISCSNGKGISLQYTITGRLSQYSGSGIEKRLQYDAFERVVKEDESLKYYYDRKVIREEGGCNGKTDFFRSGDRTVAERHGNTTATIGVDRKGSAVVCNTGDVSQYQVYSPFGYATPASRTGYTGELPLKQLPMYNLGDGTRAYMPQYGIFTSMDSFSPFSGGGINPFLYCEGDPVNGLDPSGHLSTEVDLALNIIGIIIEGAMLVGAILAAPETGGASLAVVAEVLSSTFGITSNMLGISADSMTLLGEDQETTSRLGVASSVFGLLGAATGASSGEPKKLGKKSRHHLKKSHRFRKKLLQLPEADRQSSRGAKLRKNIESSSRKGTTYYVKALEENDQNLAGKGLRKSIAALGGVDFEDVDAVLDKQNSIGKRARHGAKAVSSLSGAAISYTLLIEGTWNVYDANEEPEDSPESLANMVNEKYPVA